MKCLENWIQNERQKERKKEKTFDLQVQGLLRKRWTKRTFSHKNLLEDLKKNRLFSDMDKIPLSGSLRNSDMA